MPPRIRAVTPAAARARAGHAGGTRPPCVRRSSAPVADSSRARSSSRGIRSRRRRRWRLTFDRPGITGGTLATAGNLLFHGSNDGTLQRLHRRYRPEAVVGAARARLRQSDHLHDRRRAVRHGRHRPQRHAGARPALHVRASTPRARFRRWMPVPPPEDPSGINTAEAIRAEFERVGLPDEPARALVQQLCWRLSPADRRHALPSARGRLARDDRQHGESRHAGHA